MKKKQNICYMGTDSFIQFIQKTFAQALQKMLKQDLTLQIKNQKDHFLKEKNKKVIELIQVGKIMKEFAALRPKIYSYLTDDNDKNKKVKGTKKCVIKTKP